MRGPSSRRGRRTPSPAQSARAAFSAMSPPAGQTTTGQPHESARTSVPWPPWVITTSQPGIVRAYDSQGTSTALAGDSIGGSGARPLYVAITRTGARASPASAARSSRCSGSCAVDGATSTTGPVARRRRDPLTRRLPQQRPDDPEPRLPAARVLELRQRADERERAREPRVDAGQRRQAQPRAAFVVLPPPPLEALARRRGSKRRQPTRRRASAAAGRRASRAGSRAPTTGARAERVSRPARRSARRRGPAPG